MWPFAACFHHFSIWLHFIGREKLFILPANLILLCYNHISEYHVLCTVLCMFVCECQRNSIKIIFFQIHSLFFRCKLVRLNFTQMEEYYLWISASAVFAIKVLVQIPQSLKFPCGRQKTSKIETSFRLSGVSVIHVAPMWTPVWHMWGRTDKYVKLLYLSKC